MQCTNCGFDGPEAAKFCPQCGARLGCRCGACGHASPSGSRHCVHCGATLDGSELHSSVSYTAANNAPKEGQSFDGERRQLTVMFYDLVNSTALSARYDPEDVREAFKRFHETVTKEIVRLGGLVAQYMGDGALIFFGYPRAHEDDAERAIRSGLAAIAAISKILLVGGRKPEIRFGIATGVVVVSDVVGPGLVQAQDITGETANLAARLQSIAEPNAIVIADSTRRLVGDLFHCRALDAVDN
jgi:class 3 adenylate cyclase